MLFLKMYPRAVIDVFIMVLEADGGSRCASATAASLALADAGIPMRGLVAGVAAGKIDNKVVLDLSDIEDKIGDADVPLAMAPDRGEITLLQMDGKLTTAEFNEALRIGEEGIHQIQEMQRAVLLEKYAQIREKIGEAKAAPSDVEEKPEEEPKVTKKRTKRTKTEKKETKPKTTKKSKSSKTKDEGSETKE
jgi:exosome complex component RRP41